MAPEEIPEVSKEGEGKSGSSASASDTLLDEITNGIKEFTQKVIADGRNGGGEDSQKAAEMLGTLHLFDSHAPAREGEELKESDETTPDGQSSRQPGDSTAAKPKSTADIAREFESTGKFILSARASPPQPTKDGQPAKEVAYEDQHTLSSSQTPLKIAREQLGKMATKEQVEFYAKVVVELNQPGDTDISKAKFEKGRSIKLPGQTEDGGIVYQERDRTVTRWSDGSQQSVMPDGSGSIDVRDYPDPGHETRVSWNPNKRDGNSESQYQLVEINSGRFRQVETYRQTVDPEGRQLIREAGATADAKPIDEVESIKIVDLAGGESYFDLSKKDRFGEYHAVDIELDKPDHNTRLTAEGRVYRIVHKEGVTSKTFDDGTVVEHHEDAEKRETKRVIKEPDGRVITIEDFRGQKAHSIKIKEADGDVTQLERTPNEDGDGFRWMGRRIDKDSDRPEAAVYWVNDKLFYVSKDNPEASQMVPFEYERHDLQEGVTERYDPNAGTVEQEFGDGTKIIAPVDGGRTDIKLSDGQVLGQTLRGDVSFQSASGEAGVSHMDGTGVVLHTDGKIESWNVRGEIERDELRETEQAYLKAHPEADRRDLAEVHRRFGCAKDKLDGFYKQLARIDSAGNLTAEEKKDLSANLLHHVACPEEIYQGGAGTCNVAVIQRYMAMTAPASYADFVMDAVSEGKFVTASGKEAKFDVDNLKMIDSTRRDLASRVFQSAAQRVAKWPGEFRNTESGVGITELAWFENEAGTGMTMKDMASLQEHITGEKVAVARIDNFNELLAAYKANGTRPLTVGIDPQAPPFGETRNPGDKTPHVVTITHIEEGTPPKVYVQNQYGLDDDHSTPATAVDGQALVMNIRSTERRDGTKYGEVLISGPAVPIDVDNYEVQTNEDGNQAIYPDMRYLWK